MFEDNVAEFIKSQSKAVIATVDSESQPSTSVIFYIVDKNDEIFFVTKSHTTKFENIKSNHKAALTIVDSNKPIAVNLIGTATEITEQPNRDEIMQKVFQLSYSELHDFAPIIKLHKGSFSVFKFTPTKAKMTDFTRPIGDAKESLKNY